MTGVKILDLTDQQEWKLKAACRGSDPELFFPGKGQNAQINYVKREFCKNCPVQTECLNYAVTNDERFGIWGNRTERARRNRRRDLKRSA